MEWQDPVAESGKLGRVLVVDDVAVVRKFIRTTLAAAGYDVVEAEDGEQALRILQGMADPLPVDAILSDLRMPPINGAELVACFRRQYPAIPIVMLTAYPDVELAVSLMRQGVMDFLVKPVLQDELLSVVKRAVEQNAGRSDRSISYKDLRREVEK
nr:response regulator [Nitrospirota bacterium]